MEKIRVTEELQSLLDQCSDFRFGRVSIAVSGRAGTGKTTALILCQQQLKVLGLKVLPMAYSHRGMQRFNEQQQAMFGEQSDLLQCASIESFVLSCLKDHSVDKRWEKGRVDARLDDIKAAFATMRLAVFSLNERYALTGEQEPLPLSDENLRFYLELVNNIKISLTFEDRPFNQIEDQGYLTDEDEMDIADALLRLELPAYAFSLFIKYENCRRDATFLSWGDAVYDLVREPEAILRWCIASGVNVVLLDEFHDTKAAHFRMFEIMIKHGISVIAMGDSAQDIYQFRGISPFNAMQRFSDQAKTVLTLTRSYRYGREIANFVEEQLALTEEHTIPLKAAAHRSVHIPLVLPLALPLLCRQLLARAAKEELDEGEFPIAILTPSAEDAFFVMRELLLAGVPVQTGPGIPRCDLFDMVKYLRVIARLTGWAKSHFSANDALALISFIKLPKLALNEIEAQQLEDMLIDPYGAQRGKKHEVTYRTDFLLDIFILLRKKLELNEDLPLSMRTLDSILKRLDVLKYAQDSAATHASRKGAEVLMKDVTGRLFELGGDKFLAELELMRDRSMLGRGAERVFVSSVLQAKGMEWRVVIMPPLAWAINRNLSILERRERYVACTRARTRLYC